jgi:hypothetical protein
MTSVRAGRRGHLPARFEPRAHVEQCGPHVVSRQAEHRRTVRQSRLLQTLECGFEGCRHETLHLCALGYSSVGLFWRRGTLVAFVLTGVRSWYSDGQREHRQKNR